MFEPNFINTIAVPYHTMAMVVVKGKMANSNICWTEVMEMVGNHSPQVKYTVWKRR